MCGKFLLGNMLSSISNKVSFYEIPVEVEYNKLCENVVKVMKDYGYIDDYIVVENDNKKNIKIFLRTLHNKKIINSVKLLTKPGRRIYLDKDELKKRFKYNDCILGIVSTSKGVLSIADSIKNNIGGELLCEIF